MCGRGAGGEAVQEGETSLETSFCRDHARLLVHAHQRIGRQVVNVEDAVFAAREQAGAVGRPTRALRREGTKGTREQVCTGTGAGALA